MNVSVALIINDDKVFVGKRKAHKLYAGLYEFPGGKQEEGETALDTVVRELREELSIEVEKAEPFFNYTYVYPEFTVNLSVFLVYHYKGEIQNTQEYESCQFVWIEELEHMNLLPSNDMICTKLKEMWQNNEKESTVD